MTEDRLSKQSELTLELDVTHRIGGASRGVWHVPFQDTSVAEPERHVRLILVDRCVGSDPHSASQCAYLGISSSLRCVLGGPCPAVDEGYRDRVVHAELALQVRLWIGFPR